MKFKIDFITNSSSASFTIMRCDVSTIQEVLIIDHLEAATMLHKQNPELNFGFLHNSDKWNIDVTDTKIEGDCSMDNFDMITFLTSIGVPYDKIQQHHS